MDQVIRKSFTKAEMDAIYALLDGTNQPFTGDLTISKTSPILNFVESGNTAHIAYDGVNKILSFSPDVVGAGTSLGLSFDALEIAGTNPGFFITAGSGSSVLYWDRFQFANFFGNWNSEISADGSSYLQIRPTTLSDVEFNFTVNGLEQLGADTSTFIISGKKTITGTNAGIGEMRISGGSVTGNSVMPVKIYATGGGASGSSIKSPSLVSAFNYNNVTDSVDHYISKTTPALFFNSGSVDMCKLYCNTTEFYVQGLTNSSQTTGINLRIIAGSAYAGSESTGGYVYLEGGASDGDIISYGFTATGHTITSFTALNYSSGTAFAGNSISDFAVGGSFYASGSAIFAAGIGTGGALAGAGYALLGTGSSNQLIGIDAPSTNIAGKTLTIHAGWAKPGQTNLNSGDLILAPGTGTGTGTGNVQIQAVGGGASGTSASSPSTVLTFGKTTGTFAATGYNFTSDTITGVKFGTATTQKFSFFNASPVAQQGATIDLGVVISNFGLRAAGTAYTITTSGTTSFSGTFGSSGVSSFTNTTDASSTTTGGVKLSGGLGVAKSLYAVDSFFSTNTVIAGTSSGYTAKVGGVIFNHSVDGGNTTTTETDLYTDTLAANVLSTNDNKIVAEYGGVFVSSATATRQIRVYFAGTVILDTGALSISTSSSWSVNIYLHRVSSTVVRYTVDLQTAGASTAVYNAVGELTGLTLSGTNILKITGQAAGVGAATNDIVAKLAFGQWLP